MASVVISMIREKTPLPVASERTEEEDQHSQGVVKKHCELFRSLATPNGVLRVTPQLHGWEGRGGDGMTRKRYMMGNTTVGSKKKDIALMKKPK